MTYLELFMCFQPLVMLFLAWLWAKVAFKSGVVVGFGYAIEPENPAWADGKKIIKGVLK